MQNNSTLFYVVNDFEGENGIIDSVELELLETEVFTKLRESKCFSPPERCIKQILDAITD